MEKENKYSDYYFEAKAEFEKADKAFDAKPNSKTATKLNAARQKFEKMPESKKYTGEYLKERQQARYKADRQLINNLRHLLNVVEIETAHERGNINNTTRKFLHESNDQTNPYNN